MGEMYSEGMGNACMQKGECNKGYCCEAAAHGMACGCSKGGYDAACAGGSCQTGACASGRTGSCSSGACSGGMGNKYNEPPEEMVMRMADHAWKELMIDKMKQAYEKKSGKQMDKIAEVGVEYCIRFWASKMEHKKMKMKGYEAKMQQMDEFGDKLMEAFMSK